MLTDALWRAPRRAQSAARQRLRQASDWGRTLISHAKKVCDLQIYPADFRAIALKANAFAKICPTPSR